MINWTKIFNTLTDFTIKDFALGNLGYRDLDRSARNTPVAGEVRKLLRNRGIDKARQLARKACLRRGLLT